MQDIKEIPTEQLEAELLSRDPVLRDLISTVVQVLQKFCDDFCLHDEKIDAALDQLAKPTSRFMESNENQ